MARHHARELALRILFEYDVAHAPLDVVTERTVAGASPDDGAYAKLLAEGTVGDLKRIDSWIAECARDWKVHRMPAIDRNIMRMATYELAHQAEVPISVIIDEALELASAYSTDDAKRFVNGVLGSVAESVRPEGDPDRPAQ